MSLLLWCPPTSSPPDACSRSHTIESYCRLGMPTTLTAISTIQWDSWKWYDTPKAAAARLLLCPILIAPEETEDRAQKKPNRTYQGPHPNVPAQMCGGRPPLRNDTISNISRIVSDGDVLPISPATPRRTGFPRRRRVSHPREEATSRPVLSNQACQ